MTEDIFQAALRERRDHDRDYIESVWGGFPPVERIAFADLHWADHPRKVERRRADAAMREMWPNGVPEPLGDMMGRYEDARLARATFANGFTVSVITGRDFWWGHEPGQFEMNVFHRALEDAPPPFDERPQRGDAAEMQRLLDLVAGWPEPDGAA